MITRCGSGAASRMAVESMNVKALQLVITPVFLALAVVNYHQPNPLCTVPGDWGFLSSMWLMYTLMGIAHCGAWYRLLIRARGAAGPISTFQPDGDK